MLCVCTVQCRLQQEAQLLLIIGADTVSFADKMPAFLHGIMMRQFLPPPPTPPAHERSTRFLRMREPRSEKTCAVRLDQGNTTLQPVSENRQEPRFCVICPAVMLKQERRGRGEEGHSPRVRANPFVVSWGVPPVHATPHHSHWHH